MFGRKSGMSVTVTMDLLDFEEFALWRKNKIIQVHNEIGYREKLEALARHVIWTLDGGGEMPECTVEKLLIEAHEVFT